MNSFKQIHTPQSLSMNSHIMLPLLLCSSADWSSLCSSGHDDGATWRLSPRPSLKTPSPPSLPRRSNPRRCNRYLDRNRLFNRLHTNRHSHPRNKVPLSSVKANADERNLSRGVDISHRIYGYHLPLWLLNNPLMSTLHRRRVPPHPFTCSITAPGPQVFPSPSLQSTFLQHFPQAWSRMMWDITDWRQWMTRKTGIYHWRHWRWTKSMLFKELQVMPVGQLINGLTWFSWVIGSSCFLIG